MDPTTWGLPFPLLVGEIRFCVEEQFGRWLVIVLIAVFLNNHFHESLGSRLVYMELLRVGMIPRSQCTAKNDTFSAGKEHLSRAAGESVVRGRISFLVREANVAHPGTDA